jgi:hypothetical protein
LLYLRIFIHNNFTTASGTRFQVKKNNSTLFPYTIITYSKSRTFPPETVTGQAALMPYPALPCRVGQLFLFSPALLALQGSQGRAQGRAGQNFLP